MKPFRIFRPGTHTASCGTAVEFTKEDLAKAVAGYAPSNYASPLVIGHPKTEDRAWGQVEKLTMDDQGDVWAHADHVEAKFDDLVQSRAFPNRSASWYMPDHPNNPTPGSLYLKHIGFLGAAAPALKGLGQIEFTDPVLEAISFDEETSPDQVVEFDDTADGFWTLSNTIGTLGRFMRTLRDLRIEEKGVEDADRLLPEYVIQDAENAARDLRKHGAKLDGTPAPAFTEPTQTHQGTIAMTLTPEQIEKLQADKAAADARLAQFEERETAIAAAERMGTVDGIARDLLPLVKAGKLLPAQAKHLADFMAGLPDGADAQTIEFGEAVEGTVPKVSPRAYMKAFLDTLPKQVEFSEMGNHTASNSGALTPIQLADKARALRAQVKTDTGREISYSEATNRVLAETGATVEEETGVPNV